MKKLLSIGFIITSMIFVASSVEAAPPKKVRTIKPKYTKVNNVVRTYKYTKTVLLRGVKYLDTYQVTVFRSGITKSKLISHVKVNSRKNNKHKAVKITYKTSIVWQGGKKYRVTYKITKLPNGRTTSQIVSKIRVR
jgi:hypothetical protein